MAKKNEEIYDVVSLASEADRNTLKGFIEEGVLAKQRIQRENEALKDIRTEAKDRLKMKPALFNRLVDAVMKDSVRKVREDFEQFDEIIETLYPDLGRNAGE